LSAKERADLLRRVRRGLLGRRIARCAFPSVAVLLGVGLPILIDYSDESFGPIGIAAAVAVAALLLASSVGAILELVLGRSSGRAILAVATAALLIGLASGVHGLTAIGVAVLGSGGAAALFVRWRQARGVDLTAALVDAEAGEVHCFRRRDPSRDPEEPSERDMIYCGARAHPIESAEILPRSQLALKLDGLSLRSWTVLPLSPTLGGFRDIRLPRARARR
jgi:hypothetical protein